MIKTILVDDHAMFCDGLEKVLRETQKFEIVGKFNSGRSLLTGPVDPSANLLIIDIEMPGLSGFEVIKRLRLNNADLKIVVLSMHEEAVYINEAQAIGANGCLSKTLESATLVDLLLRVNKGERIFKTKMRESDNTTILSERELEVLKLLKKGRTSQEVASELEISVLTVKVHRRNMIRKLKAGNSAELMIKAMESGVI